VLSGVDPRVASEADAHVELSAIYTSLYTTQPEAGDEARLVSRGAEPADSLQSRPRASALEQLNRHPRLALLGDPGSGKSAFVNFVAQCLCGEALGHPAVNLQRLTEPLPPEGADRLPSREKPEPKRQPWDHGPLLPVMVTLRDFAARGLPPTGQPANAQHLVNFIKTELANTPVAEFGDHLEQTWFAGCLLLLDGLDEVPEAHQRRAQLKQVVDDFAATFGQARLLITSRTYAYQRQDWQLREFVAAQLAPFTSAQINLFVERWYAHIGPLRKLSAEKIKAQTAELSASIAGSHRLREFAERPLLLALMASLHAWRNGRLPEKRESLYNDSVDLLLETWERAKTVNGLPQPSLSEWLNVDRDKVRGLLNEQAYLAHARQPGLAGPADIPEGDLVMGLLRLTDNREVNPARLMDYLSQRAGLLLPHGVGVYTFPHRTFQEYLAACYLTDKNYPSEIAKLARQEPERWREVALLAGAKAARGGLFGVWALANKLCPRPPDPANVTNAEAYGAALAGQALAESIDIEKAADADEQSTLDRVRGWLVHILKTNALPAPERVRAGNTLAALRDSRFNPDLFYLPQEDLLGFVRIPAGKFRMGTRRADIPKLIEQFGGQKDDYDDETEQHTVELPDFYLARYPVTVAQFRAFAQDTDYTPKDEDSLRGLANHPVVNVTWHEALAYCDWLTERLRQWEGTPEPLKTLLNKEKWVITLPSEAEWEKAARGASGRLFAWEGDFDADKANVADTQIGNTSPVGCFANGATPEGVLDMTGNVWEWTRSHYKKYPYHPGDDREDLKAADSVSRVLRGGAFFDGAGYARGACRSWYLLLNWDGLIGFRVAASPFSETDGASSG
jgi:formylglycine-generating enzyme required for sulfatase activity